MTVRASESARFNLPVRRRRLGQALLAFGLVGLVLIAAAGTLVLASLSAVNDAATGFDRQRTEVLGMIGPASDALERAASSAENAGTSLSTTNDAATRAASLSTQMAASFENLAAATALDILGTRPFASLGVQFTQVAQDAKALSADLTATSAALTTNIDDSRAVAADLRVLARQLDTLEASIGATPAAPGTPGAAGSSSASLPIGAATLVLVGLLVWLAIPAIASTWLGWRLIRSRPTDD